MYSVADLGVGPGGPVPPLLFWVKKKKKEEKLARQANSPPSPYSLAQGLDLPLVLYNTLDAN